MTGMCSGVAVTEPYDGPRETSYIEWLSPGAYRRNMLVDMWLEKKFVPNGCDVT